MNIIKGRNKSVRDWSNIKEGNTNARAPPHWED